MKFLLMYQPREAHRAALQSAAPGAQFVAAESEQHAAELIRDADAVLGNRYFLQSLPHARQLRWMQSNSMGVDHILSARDRLSGIVLTNARGVYDDELAEHAIALILGLTRGLHLARDDQHAERWQRRSLPTVGELRALILGWGGIGRGIASRLRAFGTEIHAVRRSHAGAPLADPDGVTIWGPDRWREALPATQLLILALPLTPETRIIIGADELAALPCGGYVVNIGRGGTLDEAALLAALREGHLEGAGLDVLEQEPPPAGHPLWHEPRLLLTPHLGRSIERPPQRWERLFVENVRRFVAGEQLLNVVDLDRGY